MPRWWNRTGADTIASTSGDWVRLRRLVDRLYPDDRASYADAMQLDRQHMTTMKAALATMNADLNRATTQASALCRVMEGMSPTELADAANVEVDGSSYFEVLSQTCASLEAMSDAYRALRETIERRTGAVG